MSDSLHPGADESQSILISKDELLLAIRHDCVTFFALYLQEELTLEVPDFHISIWEELLQMIDLANQSGIIGVLRKLFAVPREHAKSTLAKLACILLLKYTRFKFVMYVSKTNGFAKNAIRDILVWLASPQEAELFGPLKIVKSSETESLWIVDVALRNPGQKEPTYKRVIFKALGADQQVRGTLILNQRPEIVVIDDIEDNDNTTEELQPKLDEWFMGALRKSLAKNAIMIFLGNMIRKTTLLARLSKNPDWNPTVFGSLVRDKEGALRPLWPGRWTVESLLKEYAEYRALGVGHVWEAEMMNLTHDEIMGKEMAGVVRIPMPNPEDVEAGCIVLDPAFGKNSWNDDSAITVHVKLREVTIPVVVDFRLGKYTEEELFDLFLELSYYWGLTTWFIESVAAQRLLIGMFELYMRERKINEYTFLVLPINGGQESKASRILAYRNAVSVGSYAISDNCEEVVTRLSVYDPESKDHDDLCDSAAFGTIVWQYHDSTIKARGTQQVAMLAHGDGSGRQGNRDEAMTTSC